MTAPLVSIIIPAYRASRFIGETLACIRAQTHPHWEVLVCEDGVFDNTADLVKGFAATTPNPVRLFQNQTNQGVSRARNTLIDAATGEYTAFIDADDLWLPDYLETSLERLRRSGADWQIAGARWIDEEGHPLDRREIPPVVPFADIPSELLRRNFIPVCGVVMHRRIIDRGLRFDAGFPIGEDLAFWIEIIRAGFKPLIVPEALACYRKHPAGATADVVRFPEEYARVFERYLGDPIVDQRLCRESICAMLTSVARMTWRRQPDRAIDALRRIFAVAPWHLRGRLLFIMANAARATRWLRLSGPG